MKPSEVLKKALEILGPNGEHWTQGVYGRDHTGVATCRYSTEEKTAVCFCGVGAVWMVATGCEQPIAALHDKEAFQRGLFLENFLEDVAKTLKRKSWVAWQDAPERTFPEVKAKFLEAIALAEKAEAEPVAA